MQRSWSCPIFCPAAQRETRRSNPRRLCSAGRRGTARADLESRGAVLFREFWRIAASIERQVGGGRLIPADPVQHAARRGARRDGRHAGKRSSRPCVNAAMRWAFRWTDR